MQRETDDKVELARRMLLAIAAIAPVLAAKTTDAADSSGRTTTELPPDLVESVSAYDQATLRNDVVALGKLVADDYVLVNSDATVQSKEEYLADFNRPGFRIEPYVLEQRVVKVRGDAALIAGRFHLRWTQDGARHTRWLRVAHVWIRHDRNWRITYTQLTRDPE